jgi:DNA-binding MarR family transcriptional regulator
MYNQELRPEAIEITQYTLLMALERTGETSQGKLGALLALDSTTLTRMLKPLIKRGWVHAEEGKDRRLRIFRLAAAGREKLQQSRRCWNRAQERLRAAVGENIMAQLLPLLTEVTQALGQE